MAMLVQFIVQHGLQMDCIAELFFEQIRSTGTHDVVSTCLAAPYRAIYCDTIAAIPRIARCLFREVSTPQNGAIHPLGA